MALQAWAVYRAWHDQLSWLRYLLFGLAVLALSAVMAFVIPIQSGTWGLQQSRSTLTHLTLDDVVIPLQDGQYEYTVVVPASQYQLLWASDQPVMCDLSPLTVLPFHSSTTAQFSLDDTQYTLHVTRQDPSVHLDVLGVQLELYNDADEKLFTSPEWTPSNPVSSTETYPFTGGALEARTVSYWTLTEQKSSRRSVYVTMEVNLLGSVAYALLISRIDGARPFPLQRLVPTSSPTFFHLLQIGEFPCENCSMELTMYTAPL